MPQSGIEPTSPAYKTGPHPLKVSRANLVGTVGFEPHTRTFTELSVSIAETILQTELVFCYAMLPLHQVPIFLKHILSVRGIFIALVRLLRNVTQLLTKLLEVNYQ